MPPLLAVSVIMFQLLADVLVNRLGCVCISWPLIFKLEQLQQLLVSCSGPW